MTKKKQKDKESREGWTIETLRQMLKPLHGQNQYSSFEGKSKDGTTIRGRISKLRPSDYDGKRISCSLIRNASHEYATFKNEREACEWLNSILKKWETQ